MNKNKIWSISFLLSSLLTLVLLGGLTAFIDPFFHYHAPLSFLQYPLDSEKYDRYLNDGILKHFEYDAVIAGTSMALQFKASEFDKLFLKEGEKSIKVAMNGSKWKESADRLRSGFAHHDGIQYVILTLDESSIFANKDEMSDFAYPNYLYDNNPFNDVSYLLNKTVFFDNTLEVLRFTKAGETTTSFDEYGKLTINPVFGKEAVHKIYTRPKLRKVEEEFSDEEKTILHDNLQQNVISLIKEHPETQFYLFFPPYSIVRWDRRYRVRQLGKTIDAYEYATEMLLEYKNAHVFSFNDRFDIICNLDHYRDTVHYGEWINSEILKWMKEGTGRLTEDNYRAHFDALRLFYSNYDYDALFDGEANE